MKKLRKSLKDLIRFFKNKSAVSDEDKEALEYIRYLFKDFAFRDEEEFRLLVIKPIDSEEIEYCETTQSVYIPYADIRNRADEVILGTNYEKTGNQRKAEVFRYQMKQKCPTSKSPARRCRLIRRISSLVCLISDTGIYCQSSIPAPAYARAGMTGSISGAVAKPATFVFRRPFHLSARLSRYNSRFRYFQTTSFL